MNSYILDIRGLTLNSDHVKKIFNDHNNKTSGFFIDLEQLLFCFRDYFSGPEELFEKIGNIPLNVSSPVYVESFISSILLEKNIDNLFLLYCFNYSIPIFIADASFFNILFRKNIIDVNADYEMISKMENMEVFHYSDDLTQLDNLITYDLDELLE